MEAVDKLKRLKRTIDKLLEAGATAEINKIQ